MYNILAMNKAKEHSFFSLRNIFIYFAIVLLPLSVSYFAVRNMIVEQYNAQKDILKQKLNRQSAKIPLLAKDAYQFNDFFTTLFREKKLLSRSPKVLATLIDEINRRYPQAFKWIFWDEKADIIPVKSKNIVEGKSAWHGLFLHLMKKFNVLGNNAALQERKHFKGKMGPSLYILQKALGEDTKVEHLNTARNNPVNAQWFDRKCMIVWDIDVASYQYENVPERTRGGAMAMVFEDALPEHFWLLRLLKRRSRIKKTLPFPVVALNLSDKTPLYLEKSLRYPGVSTRLLKAYINRTDKIFEFDNYMAKASLLSQDSVIRVFSIVDLSALKEIKRRQLILLKIAVFSLLLVSLWLAYRLLRSYKGNYTLKKRIAGLFLISILLPVLSLVSIGRTFLAHEEKRLYEAAYSQMEEGIEALELRYKDAPRLMENEVFKDLKEFIGKDVKTLDQVKEGLAKAVAANLIKHYIIGDAEGDFLATNWEDIHPALKNALKFSLRKIIEVEIDMKNNRKSVLKSVIDDEMKGVLSVVGAMIDLSRPSHLRYYCFQDYHMYFLSAAISVKDKTRSVVVHIPEGFIERSFVRSEFVKNIMADGAARSEKYELNSELLFYSRYKSQKHLPAKTHLWNLLEEEFNRSYQLKVKETGFVRLNNEEFLYSLKPLRTMNTQSYIPCMLTSTKQIKNRLANVRLTIFILASFAILGAFILSLILASQLLVPIKEIDQAAQKIGKGDLEVRLPEMGNDELGRLSITFNDMVKGLRERERMQAYVSESVLEAVQDNKEHDAGKTIEATILFSDIRNFTGLTERYSPDRIFALLNEFLGGVEPVIRDNNGRVDKFIGDAVMAVFHDNKNEHHALSAVKAAVAMKRFVKNMNLKRKKQGQFSINIGIGISTGNVLLGDVGSLKRKDLTVIGDEVNLASRLESASKKGRHSRVIISGSTYRNIKNFVEVEEMPFSEIRGKKQAVKIYELVKLLKT
jgi:class 3 adenylate cyclase